jgi:phenylpropionate dioxygenase-like ring-hydroxylating dioxygenase large terminal subunit
VDSSVREMNIARDDAGRASAEQAFDWRNCWYPVTFLEDLAKDRPTGFSLYDEPLVLYVDGEQNIVCLDDRCAHRAARLSDGRIMDGRIECLYHGWQYDASGKCVHIPQLAPNLRIPPKACVRKHPVSVRQGMIWIWAGDPALADESLIPTTEKLDLEGITVVDFQIDLPYDQSYLIENVIDVAHIHIAHDGIRGGGFRSAAKPLEFDVLESSRSGIRAGYKSLGAPEHSVLKAALVDYVAPNLIRYTSEYRNPRFIAGLDLYSLPLGKNRCRLLYRKYSNFNSWRERWKPRWLEHWTQCTILDQDMNVVIGQHEHIERARGRLGDLWCPIRSSDHLVIEYRKWLDRFGESLPFYRGYETAKTGTENLFATKISADRYTLHTRICRTCSQLYRRTRLGVRALWIAVALLVAVAIGAAGGWVSYTAIALGLAALAAIAGLARIKACLE